MKGCVGALVLSLLPKRRQRREEGSDLIIDCCVQAQEEFREIKEGVLAEVSPPLRHPSLVATSISPRELMRGTTESQQNLAARIRRPLLQGHVASVPLPRPDRLQCSALCAVCKFRLEHFQPLEKATGIVDAGFFFLSGGNCRTESTCTSFLSVNSGEVNPHRTWLTDDTRPVRASSISYYAPLVFESAGWIGRDAILMTGVNSISTSHAVPVPFFCR